MLVIARLIGGVGIGMLSMVAPLYVRILVPLFTDLMLCFGKYTSSVTFAGDYFHSAQRVHEKGDIDS